jgi:unsaturated pyranuronate lyase
MNKFFTTLLLIIPTLTWGQNSTPDMTDKIPSHYTALPSVYTLDKIEKETLSSTISRQYVMGAQSMLVKWDLKKGAVVPMHFHPNEQVTWITKGSVKVLSQGKEFIVKAGEIIIIPSNVPHEFHALEDTIDIDFFTPVRQDWLNGTATYLPKK